MAICNGCGSIAPTHRTDCVLCGTVFSQPRLTVAAPLPDQTHWVALEVRFECRACALLSPLNLLDVDGDVTCLNCGTNQRFSPSNWGPMVEDAHKLGDLHGPNPGGIFAHQPGIAPSDEAVMYHEVGIQHTFMEHAERGGRVRMSPGNPLCSKCHVPYQLLGRNEASLGVGCPACKETRTFELPAQARGRFAGLAGVLAAGHEANRPVALVNRSSPGVVALQCPRCGAGLSAAAESSTAHCSYCQTTCLIDSSAMWQSGMNRLVPQWWWMLLEGPSPRRAVVTDQHAPAAAPKPAGSLTSEPPSLPLRKQGASPSLVAFMILSLAALLSTGAYFFAQQATRPATNPNAAPPIVATSSTPVPSTIAIDLLWKAKVVKATGLALPKNAACTIHARTNGRAFSSMVARCGDQVLYDSQQRLDGMSNTSSVLAEAPVGDDESQGMAYAALYNDIGARQGRAQLTLDTTQQQAVVFSDTAPTFRVELETEAASEPRHGKALMFQGPAHRKPLERSAKVVSVTGALAVKTDATCRVVVRLVNHLPQASVCAAAVTCGKQVLYGQPDEMTGTGSVSARYQAACTLDATTGNPRTFADQTGSAQGSPKLELDFRAGTGTLADDVERAYSLILGLVQ